MMVFDYLKMKVNIGDEEFNKIYPNRLYNFARRNWTPVEVVKYAAKFLVDKPGKKILDIGSGVGKFCMIGAACTEGEFTGVEYREDLVNISSTIAKRYDLTNVKFIHSNIMDVRFKDYDAFYFFNPFLEHIDITCRVDDSIETGAEEHKLYTNFVREQLVSMPIGTRLATYWSNLEEIPQGYQLVGGRFDELKFWEKKLTRK
jgi:hypothetical protein